MAFVSCLACPSQLGPTRGSGWRRRLVSVCVALGHLTTVLPAPGARRPRGREPMEEPSGSEGRTGQALAVDPATPTTLYAGTGCGGGIRGPDCPVPDTDPGPVAHFVAAGPMPRQPRPAGVCAADRASGAA